MNPRNLAVNRNGYRLLPRPLETGATAIYRWDPLLAQQLEYTDRFGELARMWTEREGELHAPRAACPLGVIDRRVDGAPVRIVSRVVPRSPEQARVIREAVALLRRGESFQLEAPTGFGKTAVCCAILAAVGRTTLVVVHKSDLLEQWRAALLRHTDLQPEDIGTIQGPVYDVAGRPVVLAMIQSLVMRDSHPEELADAFGAVFFDETHHIGADVFQRAASMFRARVRLGLSATPERADGRERTVQAHIGPVRLRARSPTLSPVVRIYRSAWRCPRDRHGKRVPHKKGRTIRVEKSLAADPARNALLVRLILAAHAKGRHAVVFSSLIRHLEELQRLAVAGGVPESDTLLYIGRTPAAELATAPQRRLLFATYGMLSEGTDLPSLDLAILATPRSNVRQAVGRILRELPGKPRPVVLDVVDDDSPVFASYANARQRVYRSLGAEVKP